jgi:glycine/serine hydroxymethyltransferase
MAYPIEISEKSRRCHIVNPATAHEERRRSTLHLNVIGAPFTSLPGVGLGVSKLTRRGFEERDMRAVARGLADVLFDRRSSNAVSSEVRALSLAHPLLKFGFDQDGKAPSAFKG